MADLEKSMLSQMAGAFGISYELLSADYSATSTAVEYSAAREHYMLLLRRDEARAASFGERYYAYATMPPALKARCDALMKGCDARRKRRAHRMIKRALVRMRMPITWRAKILDRAVSEKIVREFYPTPGPLMSEMATINPPWDFRAPSPKPKEDRHDNS